MAVTNFEHYKDEIKAVGYEFAVKKNTGDVSGCNEVPCNECLFHYEENTYDFCETSELIKWLYEEYKEQPKLTKNAHEVLKKTDIEWVAKDKSGMVHGFYGKPKKIFTAWGAEASSFLLYDAHRNTPLIKGEKFSFIKWEDEEPWSAEDLLKLEVIDEEFSLSKTNCKTTNVRFPDTAIGNNIAVCRITSQPCSECQPVCGSKVEVE